jgi:cell wall integrity and stress response component
VNTAGIAAGVVVGVVALSVIIGAAFFFLRRKRARKLEGEYRRNAEISAFAQKKPNTPSSDSRWDGDYMAQRRQSNGSIDDDQDFSRRILTVTNPDGRL